MFLYCFFPGKCKEKHTYRSFQDVLEFTSGVHPFLIRIRAIPKAFMMFLHNACWVTSQITLNSRFRAESCFQRAVVSSLDDTDELKHMFASATVQLFFFFSHFFLCIILVKFSQCPPPFILPLAIFFREAESADPDEQFTFHYEILHSSQGGLPVRRHPRGPAWGCIIYNVA